MSASKAWAMSAALALASLTSVAGFDPFAGPQPIAVYELTEPYKLMTGDRAFGPIRVAVYPKGELLFRRDIENRPEYFSAKLSGSELATIIESGRTYLRAAAKRSYNVAPGAYDLGRAIFLFRDHKRTSKTVIYGWDCGELETPPVFAVVRAGKADVIPKPLTDFSTRLCNLRTKRGHPWRPRYIELHLAEQDRAYKPISWPDDWPTLSSERAVMRARDDWSIFLDGERLAELRHFLRVNENSTVTLDRRNWAISYEQVLPGVRPY